MDLLDDILSKVSFFDLAFVIITILSLIKCTRKGFVLSILSASKWLLAYILTLILFPKSKPYVEDIIDNEYVLDIALGVSIFVVVIFIILLPFSFSLSFLKIEIRKILFEGRYLISDILTLPSEQQADII